MPDWVKLSFVIFDIRALWRSALSVRVPGCQNYKWWLNPVWHMMLYNCTHMATMGVKGLKFTCCTDFFLSNCWVNVLDSCIRHKSNNRQGHGHCDMMKVALITQEKCKDRLHGDDA